MRRERRFRIQITKTGWLFIALCLAVGIAALNTGNNLLYLIFSMMLSFIVLSGILSNNTLQRLVFYPEFPDRIFAHSEAPVRLTIQNDKKWFPSFSLLLSADQPGVASYQRGFILKIPPGEKESAIHILKFSKRGRYPLPAFEVETAYPFGLIRKFTPVPIEGDAVIYPKLVPIDSLFEGGQRHLGEFLAGQSGGASNPFGIRPFVYGDPARLIHWKTSARLGELRMKEFEKEKRLKMVLDVDLGSENADDPDLIEKVLSVAASLVLDLSSRGYEISLRINGDEIRPQGRGYIDAYLTALAVAAPTREDRPDDPALADASVIRIASHGSRGAAAKAEWFIGPEELKRA